MNKFHLPLFTVATLFLVAPARSMEGRPLEIVINRSAFHPGETIRVQIPIRFHEAPKISWNQKDTVFQRSFDNFWRALIPVPQNVSIGEETLYITPAEGSPVNLIEGPVSIRILSSNFGKETILFSDSKSQLLNSPQEEEESQMIREVLKASLSDTRQLWRGRFIPPVPGKVSSAFGMIRNKVGQKLKDDFHRGVDFVAKEGDSVQAPNDGVVLLVKEFNFHGKTILIGHGQGVDTIYLHLSKILVTEGADVKKGQEIGLVGSTGLATAPNLHWGVYVQTQPVNPMQWLEEEF